MKKLILLSAVACGLLTYNAKAQTEVTFYTTMGNFTVEMYDTITPITSGNFISLVNQKFYDGIIFHRVIDNFMIQGGDPNGNGTGGPGYSIQDEFDPRASNVQKTISMANSGPNTGGSQFFINLKDNTYLDYNKAPSSSKHAVFGIVTSNFSVVQAIGKVATNASDKPTTDVVMDSVRITKFATSVSNTKNLASTIKIYPNPTRGHFLVTLPQTKTEIILTDVRGSIIYRNTVADQEKVAIDLSAQPDGIYLLQVTTATGTYRSKVLLQK